MLELSNIVHEFTSGKSRTLVRAIDGIDLTVPDETFVSLLGPSGCGKTTLLRIANGLIRQTSGSVEIDGRTITGPDPDRAMVFQEFNLLPWRTTLGNAEFGLEMQGVPKAKRREMAANALADVGLGDFHEHYPHQLSGGMKQRVGLARALCTRPRYLMMDEPFGALDPQIRELLQMELVKLWEEDRKTVLFVTHSVDEAILLSDRIVLFSKGPGRVIDDISIDLPRPRWGAAADVKSSVEFAEYRSYIWEALKSQIAITN